VRRKSKKERRKRKEEKRKEKRGKGSKRKERQKERKEREKRERMRKFKEGLKNESVLVALFIKRYLLSTPRHIWMTWWMMSAKEFLRK